eukprot:361005-Chlamydomonas_euryale.AAC.6
MADGSGVFGEGGSLPPPSPRPALRARLLLWCLAASRRDGCHTPSAVATHPAQWPHTKCSGHTPSAVATHQVQWPHTQRSGHTPSAVATHPAQWPHTKCSGHTPSAVAQQGYQACRSTPEIPEQGYTPGPVPVQILNACPDAECLLICRTPAQMLHQIRC